MHDDTLIDFWLWSRSGTGSIFFPGRNSKSNKQVLMKFYVCVGISTSRRANTHFIMELNLNAANTDLRMVSFLVEFPVHDRGINSGPVCCPVSYNQRLKYACTQSNMWWQIVTYWKLKYSFKLNQVHFRSIMILDTRSHVFWLIWRANYQRRYFSSSCWINCIVIFKMWLLYHISFL